MFLPDLVAYLGANAGILALLPTTQIYTDILAEGPLPALVLVMTPSKREHVLTGEFDGLHRDEMEIECWGLKKQDALTVRDAVLAAIDGFAGQFMGSTYVNGILVREDEGPVAQAFGTRRQYLHVLRLLVQHN